MTHFPSFYSHHKKEKKRRKSAAERARAKEARALTALTKEIVKTNGGKHLPTWGYTY